MKVFLILIRKNGDKYFEEYMEKLIFADYDYKNNLYFRNFKLEVNIEGQKIIRKNFLKHLYMKRF